MIQISDAVALHQLHRQNHMLLRNFFPPHLRQDHIRSEETLLLGVLTNGGQAGEGQLGQVVIVEANDGLIPRDGQPALAQTRHDARSQDICRREDAGDFRPFAQHAAKPLAFLNGDLR